MNDTCILVVDDNRSSSEAFAAALRDDGYSVVAASNAGRALELAADLDPDLILLDIIMPGRDRTEFVRRYLQQPGPKAPTS